MALYDAFLLPWPPVPGAAAEQAPAPCSARAPAPQLPRWAAGVAALGTSRKVRAPQAT